MCSVKSLLVLVLFFSCFSHFDAIENVDYDYDFDKSHTSDKTDDNPSGDSLLELPSDSDLIDVEHPANLTESIRDLHMGMPTDFVKQRNISESEFIEKLMRNPIVNETVSKMKEKFSNFTKNVKWNLQSFITEIKSGPNENSKLQMRNTLISFIDSLELSPLCLMSFVMMKRALSNKEVWPLKCRD